MIVLELDIDLGVEGGGEVAAHLAPGIGGVGVEGGELGLPGGHRLVVDGDAGAVRAALRHADQHRRQMRAETRAQIRILQEKAYNSAHCKKFLLLRLSRASGAHRYGYHAARKCGELFFPGRNEKSRGPAARRAATSLPIPASSR